MLLCLLLALGTGWLAWLALKGRTAWDALEAMPVTPLAEAAEGAVVRVRGRAVLAGPPLRTPHQGRPCVGYRNERGGTSEAWAVFEVHDATGTACVDTASMEVLFGHVREGGVGAERWRECWVEVDEPITVLARVVRDAHGLHLVAPGDSPLRLSNQERLARPA